MGLAPGKYLRLAQRWSGVKYKEPYSPRTNADERGLTKTAEDTDDDEEKDENLCVLSVLCGFHLVLKSAFIRVNPRRKS
jgi:hypothetical protein